MLPGVPGVPWWGAIVIAVTAAAIGFAFDAGSGGKELTAVFSTLYVAGCIIAVLAVRQASVFTAVVQPPLLLFIVVPGSYWLFMGGGFPGLRDIAINCGYPLIERFPLMLFCSAAVLLIGLGRWYFGLSARKDLSARKAVATTTDNSEDAEESDGLLAKIAARFRRGEGDSDGDEDIEIPPRRPTTDRPRSSTPRPNRTDRPTKRPAPTRSRHVRPPLSTETGEPPAERPRRRRPDPAAAEYADPDLREPRRRTRTPSARAPRSEPREPREQREPRERREAREPRRRDLPPLDRDYRRYERSDVDGYEPRPRRRRPRPEGYEPYEPPTFDAPPTPRRRPSSTGSTSSTHNPFSNVRYRGAEDGEAHVEHRSRARHRRDEDDDWRYQA